MSDEMLMNLQQRTAIETVDLSSSCISLLNKINQVDLSYCMYRTIIKKFNIPADELFNVVTHADINFIDTMGNHFLNLNQSPSNPLILPTLEKTAAIHTTIALLNNLFLSVNDKINFNWIEVETLLTKSTKWDGVGFRANSDDKIGFCLFEFSDGIKRNCKARKAGIDEKKIEKGISKFMYFSNASRAHYIRYHDMKVYFELVFLVDEKFARRTYVTVKLPTTPSELKSFFNNTNLLFDWKKSLIDSIILTQLNCTNLL